MMEGVPSKPAVTHGAHSRHDVSEREHDASRFSMRWDVLEVLKATWQTARLAAPLAGVAPTRCKRVVRAVLASAWVA
jgi:hypothetical protein